MPFKFHQPHRHRVPKAKYRVTNWAEYERGLVNRGDIRFWISQEAIEAWQAPYRKTPGGQMRFSNLAIETTLMLGALLRLPLRQSEGFLRSLMGLMQLCLPVPDHSTLARRRLTMKVGAQSLPRKGIVDIVIDSTGLKFYGAGEWSRTKHGESRRSWRKLHLSLNAGSSEIVFHELTDDDTSDAAMAGTLVSGSGGRIGRVIADGAYDGEPVYKAIGKARPAGSRPKIVIPPRITSIPEPTALHGGSERERHAAEIARSGRMAWQKRHGYGRRSLVETAISRIKAINGGRLTARTFAAQRNEVAIHVAIANKAIQLAKPVTVRVG